MLKIVKIRLAKYKTCFIFVRILPQLKTILYQLQTIWITDKINVISLRNRGFTSGVNYS